MIPLFDIGLDLARHRRKEVLEPLLHGPAASSYITTVASVIYTTVATGELQYSFPLSSEQLEL